MICISPQIKWCSSPTKRTYLKSKLLLWMREFSAVHCNTPLVFNNTAKSLQNIFKNGDPCPILVPCGAAGAGVPSSPTGKPLLMILKNIVSHQKSSKIQSYCLHSYIFILVCGTFFYTVSIRCGKIWFAFFTFPPAPPSRLAFRPFVFAFLRSAKQAETPCTIKTRGTRAKKNTTY